MIGIFTIALGGILAATIVFIVQSWIIFNDVALSLFGNIALLAGTLISLGLGYGLMGLMYKSNRAEGGGN
jgi:hypothetical protein